MSFCSCICCNALKIFSVSGVDFVLSVLNLGFLMFDVKNFAKKCSFFFLFWFKFGV